MGMPMWLALAAVQEGEGGFSSPFQVNFGLFFWTWVIFITLFFVLKRFAWPAILRATEERERKIAHQLSEAERLNAEAQAVLEEQRKLLAGARHDAHQLLQDAKAAAEKEREQILTRTRQEQEQLLERAQKELQAERDRAIADLRREAVDLSLAAAARLIGARLSADVDRRLVESYLETIEEQH
jgi:F-type H+-transporting ATPase subunit b